MTQHPLFGILVTLMSWVLATHLSRWARTPLLDPVLVSVSLLVGLLTLADIPYAHYQAGGRVISFLLGPAVVALAVPFYRQLDKVRQHLRAVLVSVLAGSVVGMLSAPLLVLLCGGSEMSARSLAPKSATTPIAIALSRELGGTPPLTIVAVVITGVLGGMLGPELVRRMAGHRSLATGLAIGTAAHGIGTARALREGPVEGAMSGLGMTLNGLFTAILLPLLAYLFL